jgi:hypothetical protein
MLRQSTSTALDSLFPRRYWSPIPKIVIGAREAMRIATPVSKLVALVLLGLCSPLLAQTPPYRDTETDTAANPPLRPVSTTRELLGEHLADPAPTALAPEPPVPAAPRFGVTSRFDYSFLPGGGSSGFGINDFETSTKFTIPLGDVAPLWLTPGGAVRLWAGPESGSLGFGPDMPPQVYDLYLDIAWRPRLAEWLFLDLAFTPGLYTDFHNLDSSAFRPRGRGVAIVALSERFQFAAGILYTNRLQTLLLPAGGIIWSPNEDTKFTLVFPAPKISRKLWTSGDGTSWWAYLAGEFGGGTWAIRRADGADDAVDYSDLRLIFGLEAISSEARSFHLEAGYVFNRRISYSSGIPGDFDPSSTIMLRAGCSF